MVWERLIFVSQSFSFLQGLLLEDLAEIKKEKIMVGEKYNTDHEIKCFFVLAKSPMEDPAETSAGNYYISQRNLRLHRNGCNHLCEKKRFRSCGFSYGRLMQ
jgi:hypothetical protein